MCHEPGLTLVFFFFLFPVLLSQTHQSINHPRSQSALTLIRTAPVFFHADFLLYFSLRVTRRLCQIIVLHGQSASSLSNTFVALLYQVKYCPVQSSRILSSVLPDFCPVSYLPAASGLFASGPNPPDCTAFCDRRHSPFWQGLLSLTHKSSLFLCSSFS